MVNPEKAIDKKYQEWRKKRLQQGKNIYPFKEWVYKVEYPKLIEEIGQWEYTTLGIDDLVEKIEIIQNIIDYRRDWDESDDLDIIDALCEEVMDLIYEMIGSPHMSSYPFFVNN